MTDNMPRDWTRTAAPVDLSPLDLPAVSSRPTYRARVGEVKIDSGRPFGVIVDVTLERETGTAVTVDHETIAAPVRLSITGEVSRTDGRRSDGAVYVSAGQIVDYLDSLDTLSPGWSAAEVSELAAIWRDWHLNTMTAGCAHLPADQLTREADRYSPGGTRVKCGDGTVNTCPVSGYRWGSAWLTRPLPGDLPGTLARLMRDRSADLYAARGYDAAGRVYPARVTS
jgi:hypothetical protein